MTSVFFITQGCSANIADSEIMAGLLEKEGFNVVDDVIMANLVVFNTCIVKGPTESFFRKRMKELIDIGKKIIIAGCIAQSEQFLDEYKDYSMIGTYQVHNIVQVVEETLNGNIVRLLARENEPRINLPKVRKNDFIEIVPISHGCLGSCSFCKTKQARGNLFSYKQKDIVRHISSSIKQGVEEIWVTSQDLSAYGKDIDTNLAKLLKDIVTINGSYMIRVGMANPDHILDFLDELIWVFKENKVYKFLHIPVQSGNNEVLKKMNRLYAIEDFEYIVKRFREEIPDITIATDIICGFPTETKKQFEDTMDLVKKIKPDVINISRFWSRPGTTAAKMKQIAGGEIKKRSSALTKLFHKIAKENNKKWIGRKCKIFVTEEGKNGTYVGRNESYKQVIVNSDISLIGDWLDVEIYDVGCFDLKGRIL